MASHVNLVVNKLLFKKFIFGFLVWMTAGILRDKTIDHKLIYIPNGDGQIYLLCKLKLLVEQFGY